MRLDSFELGKLHSSTKRRGGKRGKLPSSYFPSLNLIHLNLKPMSNVDRHHMVFCIKMVQAEQKKPRLHIIYVIQDTVKCCWGFFFFTSPFLLATLHEPRLHFERHQTNNLQFLGG